jgi:DNA-binding MltR family transcriptional regulator
VIRYKEKAVSQIYQKDFKDILYEVETDGVRGATLSAAAVIDEFLKRAIRTKLIELSNDEEKRLFHGHGPISSLSSRIMMSYALGIFGPITRKDVNVIRDIRNRFAHTLEDLDFETPAIADRIKNLNCIQDLAKDTPPQQLLREATLRLSMHVLMKVDQIAENDRVEVAKLTTLLD